MCISWVRYDAFLCSEQSVFVQASYALSAGSFRQAFVMHVLILPTTWICKALRLSCGLSGCIQNVQLRALATMKSRNTFSLAAFFISSG
jgi:hypothetical protein